MTTISYPMPERYASLEDIRTRMMRAAYATDRPLWEFVSDISNHSFTLFGEWDSPRGLTYPFQVSVTYRDHMLHYTPETIDGRGLTRYLTEYFIPRVHPRQ